MKPKLNTLIKYWNKSFGFGYSGNPKWKIGKCIYFENEFLFIENNKKSIITNVTKWEYLCKKK